MLNPQQRLKLLREGFAELTQSYDSFLKTIEPRSEPSFPDSLGVPSILSFELSSETHSEAT